MERFDAGSHYRPAIVAGRYRVEEVVRETETHDVVFGIDRVEDRPVVLKRLKSPERSFTTRLRSVQRALSGLRHPSLMTVVDLVEGKRDAWLVSEQCPGPDLAQYWARLPLETHAPFEERWEYARPILVSLFDGLEALHRAQIAHLDLKPTNVRMDPSGRAVLVDVGLGDGLDMEAGEVGYLAPELIDGLYVSRMADQWSLGAVIYRLLTGRAPIEGGSREVVEAAYAKGEVMPLRDHRPEIPRKIEDIVLRMLRWEPDARFESIGAAWAAFGESLGKAPHRPLAPWSAELPPLVGRDRLLDLFQRQLLQLRGGNSAVVQLVDGKGSGKTRLLDAWTSIAAADPGLRTHRGTCLPGAPRAVLRGWFRPGGTGGEDADGVAAAALEGLGGPAVVLLDDLESIEDSTWQLVRAAAELVSTGRNPHPLLLVLSGRSLPEKHPLDPSADRSFRVLLPALGEAELEGLLRPGDGGPPIADTAAAVLAASRGRPDRVFTELLEAERRGELSRIGRRWVTRGRSEPAPMTLPPVSMQRFFGLLAEISRPLPVDLLLQCAPLDRVEVVEVLSFAGEQQLVDFRYRDGRWWVASSAPTDSDAAPEYPTAEFHARAALWLQRNFPDGAFAETVGHHQRQAGRVDEAAAAFAEAAEWMTEAGEAPEAKRLNQLARLYRARAAR